MFRKAKSPRDPQKNFDEKADVFIKENSEEFLVHLNRICSRILFLKWKRSCFIALVIAGTNYLRVGNLAVFSFTPVIIMFLIPKIVELSSPSMTVKLKNNSTTFLETNVIYAVLAISFMAGWLERYNIVAVDSGPLQAVFILLGFFGFAHKRSILVIRNVLTIFLSAATIYYLDAEFLERIFSSFVIGGGLSIWIG